MSSAPKIRSAPSAASPAPTPRPSLDAFISLYTTLHHLATLRAAAKAAEVSFTSSRNDLQHNLTALQAEVGEARARREVERQLGMLKKLRDAPLEIVETLRDVAGAMEQSSALLSSVESYAPDLRTSRDATCKSQKLQGCVCARTEFASSYRSASAASRRMLDSTRPCRRHRSSSGGCLLSSARIQLRLVNCSSLL